MIVSAPLLPGHGTSVEMNRCRWQEGLVGGSRRWLVSQPLFARGWAFHGKSRLYLAAQHPDLPGAMAYAPALKIADGDCP